MSNQNHKHNYLLKFINRVNVYLLTLFNKMETQKKCILEACVTNFNEAQQAELKNAHRIELCENLTCSGTTPSFGTIW